MQVHLLDIINIMKTNNDIIAGFKAVEFMRQERDQISNEIQNLTLMNFKNILKNDADN